MNDGPAWTHRNAAEPIGSEMDSDALVGIQAVNEPAKEAEDLGSIPTAPTILIISQIRTPFARCYVSDA